MNNELEDQRIERAIEELRLERAPFEGRAKAIEAMIRPRRSLRFMPALAAGVAASLLTFVFWPQQRALAWSQVVQATLGTERMHEVTYGRNRDGSGWVVHSVEWRDGAKFALMASFEGEGLTHKLETDFRYDGARSYWKNWNGYGVIRKTGRSRPIQEFLRQFSFKELLSNPRIKLGKAPKDAAVNGEKVLEYDAIAYEGRREWNFGTPVKFFVEKNGDRVVRSEVYGVKNELSEYSTVEYSSSISQDHFLPPKDGPITFDLDRDGAELNQAMANGRPFGQGNILRAAVQAPDGSLVILWTGAAPNAGALPRPVVVNHSVRAVSADLGQTSSWWKTFPASVYWYDGQPLCGLVLQLDKPVGDQVTLKMPVLVADNAHPFKNGAGVVKGYRSRQAGTATIRDFPVLHTIPFTVMDATKGFHK